MRDLAFARVSGGMGASPRSRDGNVHPPGGSPCFRFSPVAGAPGTPVPTHLGVVFSPDLPKEPIATFRREHNPYAWMDPHITLVFAVPGEIGRETLVEHVRAVASSFPPFEIRLDRLTRSFDQWLFLAVSDGNAEMVDLHDRLYTGLLAPFLRSDIEYIPHVSLGHFGRPDAAYDVMEPEEVPLDRPRFARALREAKRLRLDYRCKVASIGVVGVDAGLRGLSRDEVWLGKAH